jgi:hypothetical protein
MIQTTMRSSLGLTPLQYQCFSIVLLYLDASLILWTATPPLCPGSAHYDASVFSLSNALEANVGILWIPRRLVHQVERIQSYTYICT